MKMSYARQGFFRELTVNPRDKGWIMAFFLIFIILYYSILQSQSLSSYGNIYSFLFVISLMAGSIAFFTKNKLFGFMNFGATTTNSKYIQDLIIGAAFGGVLVFGYATSNHFLSFFTPPLLSIAGTTLAASLSSLVVVGFFGPLIEEFGTQSVLNPTLVNFIKTGSEFPFILVFIGIIFAFIIPILAIAIVAFVAAAAAAFNLFNIRGMIASNKMIRFMTCFMVTAFAFSIFHVFAFGNTLDSTQLFLQAFGFSIIDSIINWRNGSTVSGELAHIINNSFIFCLIGGIPLTLAFLMVFIYILAKTIVFKAKIPVIA